MYKATIKFEATGHTEEEVLEAILFDLHEEFRREGSGIEIEEIDDKED